MFGKMNMAILGCGNIAGVMADTVRHVSGVKPYAVASRNMEKAKKFAKEHGFKKAYGSYEELLSDKKVDLVYIATPHSEHYENAKLCIEHGKAVLCEKSFMVNRKLAEEIFALAAEKKVFITEAMWIRYMPMYKTITDVLNSKVIGDPVMLSANLGYNIRWVKRMTDPALAGGALLDVGVYPINFASMMFGDDILKVDATCTYTDTGVDEQDSITLTYRDGRMAVLNASMLAISDRKGIIQGTKGFMVVENINNFESLTVYDSAYNKIGFYKRPKQRTGYEYEVEACVRAIKSGWLECPEMPHDQTLRILGLMDQIRETYGISYACEDPEAAKLASAAEETNLVENVTGVAPALAENAETPVEGVTEEATSTESTLPETTITEVELLGGSLETTSEEATSNETASAEATSTEMTSEEVTSTETTSAEATSTETASEEAASSETTEDTTESTTEESAGTEDSQDTTESLETKEANA